MEEEADKQGTAKAKEQLAERLAKKQQFLGAPHAQPAAAPASTAATASTDGVAASTTAVPQARTSARASAVLAGKADFRGTCANCTEPVYTYQQRETVQSNDLGSSAYVHTNPDDCLYLSSKKL